MYDIPVYYKKHFSRTNYMELMAYCYNPSCAFTEKKIIAYVKVSSDKLNLKARSIIPHNDDEERFII